MLQFMNFNNRDTEESKETWRYAEVLQSHTEMELIVNMKLFVKQCVFLIQTEDKTT